MPPYVQPPPPRNLTQEYTAGGATSTVPGVPVGGGVPVPSGDPMAMIRALSAPPMRRIGPGVRQADALEGRSQRPGPPGPPAHPDPMETKMKQLQLQKMQQDLDAGAAKARESEVWMQNGPYGMQKVSPGTPGASRWQSG